MTLVLALRCRDGIVLASDGQATSDAAGQPTRTPVRKLFDIGGQIAWGAAGSAGLQQTLLGELELLNGHAREPGQLRRRLAKLVGQIQQVALRDFVAHAGCEAPELACLFCWWDAGGPRILTVPRTGSDHRFNDGYAAVGSGDLLAELALRSMVGTGAQQLSVEQAKMVAYRAVADAIEVAAVFLGPPIQMSVITHDGVQAVPREELDGALPDAVELWKTRQRETLGVLAG